MTYVADSERSEVNLKPHGDSVHVRGTEFLGDSGQLIGQPTREGIVRGGWKNSMFFSMLVKVSMG